MMNGLHQDPVTKEGWVWLKQKLIWTDSYLRANEYINGVKIRFTFFLAVTLTIVLVVSGPCVLRRETLLPKRP